MTPARLRRLAADYEEVTKNFSGHKYISVTPIGEEPPEKYHVTYFVPGIYLLPDGRIQPISRHEVEITLHADYPRYKPICRILTPIWHPNFRDGQICIGDIWGAGESLSDIIVNIGDMIQYKSWNSFSPLSADAAEWAINNKQLFPVGNLNLYYGEGNADADEVDIDLFDEPEAAAEAPAAGEAPVSPVEETQVLNNPVSPYDPFQTVPELTTDSTHSASSPAEPEDDFEITAEELAGIEYIPTAQRMQTLNGVPAGKATVNFKTVFQKGILWALIGALLGFLAGELLDNATSRIAAAKLLGYSRLANYYTYDDMANAEFDAAIVEFEAYCEQNGLDSSSESALTLWILTGSVSADAQKHLDNYSDYSDKAEEALYASYKHEFGSNEDKLLAGMKTTVRLSTALWSAIIALFIGALLGIGEGVFYGSSDSAVKYGIIGAVIAVIIGFVSGYLAQWMYNSLLGDDPSLLLSSLIRGLGWAIMGVGIGLATGLIRPQGKRILFCTLGGLIGAFLGGFVFNYICKIIPIDTVARGTAILLMGALIGGGVGLLEQFAKQAWLKVIRGEFEGKEYLVFAGTTSIGNNARNTIVLFKDKLIGAHHCDIIQEGSKYVIVDCGTPMGTVINGMRTGRHVLRRGDIIAIGNTAMVFNTK